MLRRRLAFRPGSVADWLTISNRLCGRNRRGAAFVRRRVGLWRVCEQWRARCFSLYHLSFGGRGLGLGRHGSRLGGYGAARRAGAGGPAAAARRGGLSVDLRRISFKGEFGSRFRVRLGCDSGRVFLRFTRFGAPALTSTFGGFGRRLLHRLLYWERRSFDGVLNRIRLQLSRRVRRLRLDVAARRKIRLWQRLDRRLRGCDHRLKLPDPGHHLKLQPVSLSVRSRKRAGEGDQISQAEACSTAASGQAAHRFLSLPLSSRNWTGGGSLSSMPRWPAIWRRAW